MSSRGRIPLVAVMDGVGLLAFVVVGIGIHGGGITPVAVIRDAGFLMSAWYASAAVSRLYRNSSWSAFLLTWGVAIPLGILVRQAWVGRPMTRATVAFLIAALVLTLVFLITGRVLTMLMTRAAKPSS